MLKKTLCFCYERMSQFFSRTWKLFQRGRNSTRRSKCRIPFEFQNHLLWLKPWRLHSPLQMSQWHASSRLKRQHSGVYPATNHKVLVKISNVERSKVKRSKTKRTKVRRSKVKRSKVKRSKVERSKVERSKVKRSKGKRSKVKRSKVKRSKGKRSKVRRSKVKRSKVKRSKVKRSKVKRSKGKRSKVKRSKVKRSKVRRSKVKRSKVRRSKVKRSKVKKTKGRRVEGCLWKVVKKQGFHFKRNAWWIFWWERSATNKHRLIIFLTKVTMWYLLSLLLKMTFFCTRKTQ